MKRIRHNDLTHYFIREHSTLPAAYLASCEKFFKELSIKQQAPVLKIKKSYCNKLATFSSGEGGRVGPKVTSSQAKIKVDK